MLPKNELNIQWIDRTAGRNGGPAMRIWLQGNGLRIVDTIDLGITGGIAASPPSAAGHLSAQLRRGSELQVEPGESATG